ncbi:BSD domain-containing protein 1 [Iris pallida]|uniref:BSD domain-containing protein 1 n=1 Tax=Iris pallida TaxID=29817 RepID=A0AAX6FY98_IRIPA|nr:BSD domain-containing protein 1 [Iris pallida]
MDFFKSVFSTEEEEEEREEEKETSPNPNPSETASGAWSFGGLIKTFATRSESVIQTYRRDLEEFGSGLKKETEAIKEAASRAVVDLPGSLEAGASAAQESLESVGQAIDELGGSVWRGTAGIISHGRDALLAADHPDESPPDAAPSSSKRYSRLEAQVAAAQSNASTFSEEPEDGEDFGRWKMGFRLEEKEEEIEMLLYENGVLEGFFEKLVPGVVDRNAFWSRYYYRVYKLQQAEDARAKLVKRVIVTEEAEEELSWEVDDEEEVEEKKEIKEEEETLTKKEKEIVGKSLGEKIPIEEATKEEIVETSKKPAEELSTKAEVVETLKKPTEELSTKVEIVETLVPQEEKEPTKVSKVESLEEEEKAKSKVEDNKSPSEVKPEPAESSKDSNFSVVSSQPSMQDEDDLGWDEIEDLGEHEDNKLEGSGGSPRKVDLRKRLSVAEDDEDLSWDIEEDEDEPTKT